MSTVHHQDEQITLHLGDCLNVLPTLPDASIDAIVTDPPYALTNLSTTLIVSALTAWLGGDRAFVPAGGAGFMNRSWDRFVPPPAAWDECLRVLKPGGHLLCFAAPRTMDLMGLSIRLAGFEIRDGIGAALMAWTFGQGFPKGQDIGKAIDRRRDDRDGVLRVCAWLRDARDAAGWTSARIDALFGFNGMASHWAAREGKAAVVPTLEQWAVLRDALGFDDADILPIVEELNARKGDLGEAWGRREVVGEGYRVRRPSDVQLAGLSGGAYDLTAPATEEAGKWEGWNTTLKPAWEPIIVARKSTGFNTTVANVLEHGTGALNVGACRTAVADPEYARNAAGDRGHDQNRGRQSDYRLTAGHSSDLGRWPTNVVLAHAPGCEQAGVRVVRNPSGSVTGDEPSALIDAVYAERKRVPYQARQTETVAVWECEPGCPVAEMDRQSGVTSSSGGSGIRSGKVGRSTYGAYDGSTAGRNAGGLGDAGGASRFFPVFRHDQECELFGRLPSCERVLTAATRYPQDARLPGSAASAASADMSPNSGGSGHLAKSSARTVVPPSGDTDPSSASTAREGAPLRPSALSDLRASSAGRLCDSCVTAIARSVAATARGHSVPLALGLPSTADFSERILSRSLALIAEDLGKRGTTSTTTDLMTSLGCVADAISMYTTRASLLGSRRSGHPVLKYEAKAPASERPKLADGTAHATVKPLDLMRWLVRLVTPPGGTILDPFAGSGTTGEAAILEGFNAVLVEREREYADLCVARLSKPLQPSLFGEAA